MIHIETYEKLINLNEAEIVDRLSRMQILDDKNKFLIIERQQECKRLLALSKIEFDNKFDSLKKLIGDLITSYLNAPYSFDSINNNMYIEAFNMAIMKYLLRDLYYVVEKLNTNNFLYVDLIIRQMYEHIIEYCYIIEIEGASEELIKDYLGANITLHSSNQKVEKFSTKKFSNDIKKIAEERYKKKNDTSISAMVKKIEGNQRNEDSLYYLYCVLSDQIHNKYFFEWIAYNNNSLLEDSNDTMKSFYLNILHILLKRLRLAYNKNKNMI